MTQTQVKNPPGRRVKKPKLPVRSIEQRLSRFLSFLKVTREAGLVIYRDSSERKLARIIGRIHGYVRAEESLEALELLSKKRSVILDLTGETTKQWHDIIRQYAIREEVIDLHDESGVCSRGVDRKHTGVCIFCSMEEFAQVSEQLNLFENIGPVFYF